MRIQLQLVDTYLEIRSASSFCIDPISDNGDKIIQRIDAKDGAFWSELWI